jgi:hypothetical protein
MSQHFNVNPDNFRMAVDYIAAFQNCAHPCTKRKDGAASSCGHAWSRRARLGQPPAAGVYVLKRPGIEQFLSSGVKIDIVEEYRDVGSASLLTGSLKSGENHGRTYEERCAHEYFQDVHIEMVADRFVQMGNAGLGNCDWNLLARFVWPLSSYSHKHGHG